MTKTPTNSPDEFTKPEDITPEQKEKAEKIAGYLDNMVNAVTHDPNMAELIIGATLEGLAGHNKKIVLHLQKLMIALDAALHLIVNDVDGNILTQAMVSMSKTY